MSRTFAVLDAPSNLGLRPPAPGVVPGVYKMAGALRDLGIVPAIDAVDVGVATAPRYQSAWEPGDGARNAEAIARYSTALADRVAWIRRQGWFPVLLGGDCSILIGSTLALRRTGRFGLAFIDGHTDFRHEGNSDGIGAAAGEDLAIVTGRGDARLVDLEGRRPYVLEADVAVAGVRGYDEHLDDLRQCGVLAHTVEDVVADGPEAVAERMLGRLERPELEGFWIHVDVDVLDPAVMPAVDSPDPPGLDLDQFRRLLGALLGSRSAAGLELCILDPDLDEDGSLAATLTRCLVGVLTGQEPEHLGMPWGHARNNLDKQGLASDGTRPLT